MDAHEGDILAKAVAERVIEHTKELLETAAKWAIIARDRVKIRLWFFGIAILAAGLAFEAELNHSLVVLCFIVSVFLFEWWLDRNALKKWQRREFARQHFRVLLECRRSLEGMTNEERIEVKPDIVKWLLGDFFPGGLEQPLLWDGEEQEGIFFPALYQMRLESMGLKADQRRTILAAEYAYKNYSELDPDLEWIRKLHTRRPS
jgi:hypothetical protein